MIFNLDTLTVVMIILFAVVSIIDMKSRKIPSIFMTGLLLIPLSVNIGLDNITSVMYGVLSFGFAFLLYDLDFFKGMADIKGMTALGLMQSTMMQFGLMMTWIAVMGLLYKIAYASLYKIKKIDSEEIPFIPVFFIVLIIMVFGGNFGLI